MVDPQKKDKGLSDKMQEQWQSFKQNDKVGEIVNYTKTHKRDTIAYALLVVGVILLFLEPVYGGLLIGIVASIYFSQDLWNWIVSLRSQSEHQGMAKILIFTITAIALFINAPAIFIGFAIGALLQKLLMVDET